MAQELTTIGVLLKYAVSASGTTRPTAGYTQIPNVKSIPDFNPEPESLEVTDLSDKIWRRYTQGLKDPGGAMAFTVNLTSAFKTAWTTLMTAYATAASGNKSMWFEIMVPDFGSFYFAGIPAELGMKGMDVNAVLEDDVYITPNIIHGWDTSSTVSA